MAAPNSLRQPGPGHQPEPDPRLILSQRLLEALHRAWKDAEELRKIIARMEAGEHRFRCVGCQDTTWTKGNQPTPHWKHYPEGWRCQDCATIHDASTPQTMGLPTGQAQARWD